MNARDLPAMSNVNLQHYWMPFTDNRRFKAKPRLVASAKDMYFTTVEGKQVLDGLATLWCVNAGHGRPRIVEAIRKQAGELDFAASFSLGHPLAFRLAARTRFVGRERSYHGVNIAGISVGGVAPNRKAYSGVLLPGVDHLRHTHGFSENLFARDEP